MANSEIAKLAEAVTKSYAKDADPNRALDPSSKPKKASSKKMVRLNPTEWMEANWDVVLAVAAEMKVEAVAVYNRLPVNSRATITVIGKARSGKEEAVYVDGEDLDALTNELRDAYDGLCMARDEYRAKARQEAKEKKEKWVAAPGEHGNIYLPGWQHAQLKASVLNGDPVILVGPPGTAKTDTGRAIPNMDESLKDYKVFALDITGMSEPSQLEAVQDLVVEGGGTKTVLKPSPLIEALRHVEDGGKAVVFVDEMARVPDMLVLNPFLGLISHGIYHALLESRLYRVSPDNFVVVASANIEHGFNFSGNNRRGLDAALLDRFQTRIRLSPIPVKVMDKVLYDRYPTLKKDEHAQLIKLYQLARGDENTDGDPDRMKIVTTRTVLYLARLWPSMGGIEVWGLSELCRKVLAPLATDETVLKALIGAMESARI